jgi:phage/plasmid-associated DNA primase
VREASEDYLAGEDVLGQWLEERCVVSARIGFTQSTTLYADWREWCADSGLQAGSTRLFPSVSTNEASHEVGIIGGRASSASASR